MHKALLLMLFTAASTAAQTPPAAFNSIRASDGYRNALTQTAQKYEQALSTHCAKVELQMPAMNAKILGPFQLDAKGDIVTATWKESVPGTACGETRLYNAFSLVRNGKPQMLPTLPGHSFAGPLLQHDAMTEAVAEAAIAGAGKDCAYDTIDTALTNGEPASAHANWDEQWTLRACGKRYLVTLHFIPDAKGTTIHGGGRETVVLP